MTRYGEWETGKQIGRGGQGRVYLAHRDEGEAQTAIKVIRALPTQPKRRARLIQEIRQHVGLSAAKAPNIMPILDHNLAALEAGDTTGYIVMPYAQVSLSGAIDTLRGRVDITLDVFRGILEGIASAHAAGIIHRDIKPENILFEDFSLRRPLVADFGICFLKDTDGDNRLTDVGETVGAKWFMAPEQQRGGPIDVAETADIYALGKILAYSLTGRYIHREDVRHAFTDAELAADRRLDRILSELIARTVAEDPDARIKTVRAVIDIVDKLRDEFRGGGAGGGADVPKPPARPTLAPDTGGVIASFNVAKLDIAEQAIRRAEIRLDEQVDRVVDEWNTSIRPAALDSPQESSKFALELLDASWNLIGTTLALAKFDEATLFPAFRKRIERLTDLSTEETTNPLVAGIPHVLAGFLYMSAAVISLQSESWHYWDRLLNTQFRWYYRSGKPQVSFGFEHPYFFHSEAMKRSASVIHDFYRERLATPDLKRIVGLESEQLLSTYVQVQFLMSIRGSQLRSEGQDINMWADFGRFYGARITSLLHRIESDVDFAAGVLKPFGENRAEWFANLNARLSDARAESWGRGSGFFWESIRGWEPANPAL